MPGQHLFRAPRGARIDSIGSGTSKIKQTVDLGPDMLILIRHIVTVTGSQKVAQKLTRGLEKSYVRLFLHESQITLDAISHLYIQYI